MVSSLDALPIWIAVAILAGAGLTWGAIAYARRRALYDLPGRRRSHRVATPRGGGIAIVIVVAVAALMLLLRTGETSLLPAFVAGLAAVALIGWIDDHRSISAMVRLAVHVSASGVFVASLPAPETDLPLAIGVPVFGFKVLVLATAINFFNFMDGINGLVATQSTWVAACLAVLLALAGHPVPATLAAVLAAACLGFLPFNFPRARIFLGDVGSGGLGFACGALGLWCESVQAEKSWVLLPIACTIGIDAGLTLLDRMRRGRRWYTAHREHLYQWMVRSGRSHACTTLLYLGWNFVIVLPFLILSRSTPAPVAAVAVVVAGGLAWCLGKRRLLQRARAGRSWR